jgi:hypothetical protein
MYIEVILENECFILLSDLWLLCVILTFATDTWIFGVTLGLTMEIIWQSYIKILLRM